MPQICFFLLFKFVMDLGIVLQNSGKDSIDILKVSLFQILCLWLSFQKIAGISRLFSSLSLILCFMKTQKKNKFKTLKINL